MTAVLCATFQDESVEQKFWKTYHPMPSSLACLADIVHKILSVTITAVHCGEFQK